MTVYVLCTNDFSGAWDPAPARFGLLPGGRGLRDAVQALKSRGPAIWADAGDLVDGGALFAAGGDQAWLAGATLGIDARVGGTSLDPRPPPLGPQSGSIPWRRY